MACSSRIVAERLALALIAFCALVAARAGAEGAAYRVGAGDVLQVQVWREPDLSGPHRIDETGNLRHVLAGTIPAAGRTCEEIAEEIRARLERDYLRDARVIVSLESSARRRAWVLGAVAKPGSYPVTDATRVLDLVFAAGGVSVQADGHATYLQMGEQGEGEGGPQPPQGEPVARIGIDLAALLAGDLSGNRGVRAGDVLVVEGAPAAVGAQAGTARIRVVGEVVRPGTYELSEAPTALDAVLAAGGFTEYASANRSRLVRGEGDERSEETLRLGDIVEGREDSENVALRAGDLIVVPESFF